MSVNGKIFAIFVMSGQSVWANVARLFKGFFVRPLQYGGGFISVPEREALRKDLTSGFGHRFLFGHCLKLACNG